MAKTRRVTTSRLYPGDEEEFAKLRELILSSDLSYKEVARAEPFVGCCTRWVKDLIAARDRERIERNGRRVEVHFLHGDTCTGKTLLVEKLISDLDQRDVYRVRDYIHSWDQYDKEKVVVYDDLRPELINTSYVSSSLQPEVNVLRTRHGDKLALFHTVYLISNRSYSEWKSLADKDVFAGLVRSLTSVEELREDGELVWDEEFVKDVASLEGCAYNPDRSILSSLPTA